MITQKFFIVQAEPAVPAPLVPIIKKKGNDSIQDITPTVLVSDVRLAYGTLVRDSALFLILETKHNHYIHVNQIIE